MRKLVYAGLLIALCGAAPHLSRAATILDTTGVGTSTSFDANGYNTGYVLPSVAAASPITVATGTTIFYSFYIGLDESNVCENAAAYGTFYLYDFTVPSLLAVLPPAGMASNSFVQATTTLTSAITAGDNIGLFLSYGSNTHRCDILGTNNGTRTYATAGGIYDINFYLGTTPPGAPAPGISFVFPTNLTSTTEFAQWQLLLTNVSTSLEYRVDVEYSAFGSLTTYDDFNLLYPTYVPGEALINKTRSLTSLISSGTTWTASAYLLNSTSTDFFAAETHPAAVLASSSITFVVGVPSGLILPSTSTVSTSCGNPPASFFALTGSPPYFSIGNPIESIEYGGCMLMAFAFVPNPDEATQISTVAGGIGAILKNKPPFGYFAQAIGAMSFTLSTTSTSTFLDATSTSAVSGFFNPLDIGMGSIVGFLLLLWLFNRGRHFEP